MTDPADAARRAARSQVRLNAFTHIEEPGLLPVGVEGALGGVPVAVKDLLDHKGRVTTCGSAFYRHTAERTAPAVERVERAGGVVIGRTGLHEFAYGFSSENPHFGPVRNPWDTDTSAGGSSGGSGAAVAAGIVPVAVGTDTGGSVRVPAALCGCYGLKVTHGAIPLEGVFPLVPSIDTVGPLADSVENLTLAYRVMAADLSPHPEPGRLRFGIPQPWYDLAPLAEEVAGAFLSAVASIEEMGHQTGQLHMPDVVPDHHLITAIAPEIARVHRRYHEEGREYGPDVSERLGGVFAVTPAEAEEGSAWQRLVRERFSDAFATVDFLITPTVAAIRKVIGEDLIAGEHHRKVLSWFTAIVNHALSPAIALPLQGTGRPPVSLQVIGPPGSELALLSLAGQWERAGLVGFTPAGTDRNDI